MLSPGPFSIRFQDCTSMFFFSLNLFFLVPVLACLAWFAVLAGLPWLALLACLALPAGGDRRVGIDSRNCLRTLVPRSASGFDIGISCLGSLSELNFSFRFQNEL